MTKQEIFDTLNEITSHYSFGRILGYLQFSNIGGADAQLETSQLSDAERLMNSEKNLLAGLWLHNIDYTKVDWGVFEDDNITQDVYQLMAQLHNCYRFTPQTPFEEQIKEIVFYEGDEGYDKQFVRFAEVKYAHPQLARCLKENYAISVECFVSTYCKLKRFIEEQISRRIETTRKRAQRYISPINAFTIKEKDIRKHFTPNEIKIIDAFSVELGKARTSDITDIADRNEYLFRPIIKLPNDNGRFIPDFVALAIAINETPMFMIRESKWFKEKALGNIKGEMAENLVASILQKRFPPENIICRREIFKSQTGNKTSEIDVMLHVPESNTVIVLQVKSKRLTESSKQGKLESIIKDYQLALENAYNQGITCIDCLKHYKDYYSLKDLTFITSDTRFYVLCVTLDQYPTISTQGHCLLSKSFREELPPIVMTAYDLDEIIDLIPKDDFVNYLSIRKELINKDIRGLNEMYYIGAFLSNALCEPVYINKGSITREHAVFGDYIYNGMIQRGMKVNSYEDIGKFLMKHPIKTIQCQ